MSDLSKLPNIGLVLEKQLTEVGIHNKEDLINMGSKDAWFKIRQVDPSACINRLYALEGAIREVRWHSLPQEVKEDLKEFYSEWK